MLLVILAVVQIVLLAVLVILSLKNRRKDSQNSVQELLTGLADLRSSVERLEGKVSAEIRNLREDSLAYSQQARQEAAVDSRSLREELFTHVGQLGGQLNDNMTEFRRDQISAANQLRDGVTAQIDRLVNSTTESDQHRDRLGRRCCSFLRRHLRARCRSGQGTREGLSVSVVTADCRANYQRRTRPTSTWTKSELR